MCIEVVMPPLPGDAKLVVQGETFSDRRITLPLYKRLYDAFGAFKRTVEFGKRFVTIVTVDRFSLAFKHRPELPGLHTAVGELVRRVFGETGLVPHAELMRFPGPPPRHEPEPILVSQNVVGKNLLMALREDSTVLSQLDPRSLSEAIIAAILTNPADGKPENYICELMDNGLYRLVCVDCEHSFLPYQVTPSSKNFLKQTIVVKSVLYCFGQMLDTVHSETRKTLLQMDPLKLLHEWLAKLVGCGRQHQALFTEAEATLFINHPTSPTILGIPLGGQDGRDISEGRSNGIVNEVYSKLCRIKTALTSNEHITHYDLLCIAEPAVALRYSNVMLETEAGVWHGRNAALASGHVILERFSTIDGKFYKVVNGVFSNVTTDGFKLLQQQGIFTPQSCAVQLIFGMRDFCPAKGLEVDLPG